MGGIDMAIRRTSGFAVVVTVLMLGTGANLKAAPPMGIGGLAARQSIKNQIVDALADGYISPTEYEDIMSKAQDTLQPQEMAGLQRTMDRLMTQTNSRPTEVVMSTSMPPQDSGPTPPHGFGRLLKRYTGWEADVARSAPSMPSHQMPYYQTQKRPSLFEGGIQGTLSRLPYIERPSLDGSHIKQVTQVLPPFHEILPGRPALLSSKSSGGYIVRTMPTSMPQVSQTAGRSYRVSAAKPSRPPTRVQRIATTEKTPEVEAPIAMAPMPDDAVDRIGDMPSPPVPQRSGPDYRTSRTAYLESLRTR
jgi:hypothetical protein